jgi:hypothetical protein
MIQVNDLRIGNVLLDDLNKRVVCVHGIEPSWNEVWVNYSNGKGVYKLKLEDLSFNYISFLVLEKYGFSIKDSNVDKSVLSNGIIDVHHNSSQKYWVEQKNSFGRYIEFEHQLQNFQFYVRNEELSVVANGS